MRTIAMLCLIVVVVEASLHAGGMEFDRETEEELLRAFTTTTTTTTTTTSSDYSSSMELQDIGEDDTKIVLMDDSQQQQQHPPIMKTTNVIYQVGNSDDDLPECEEASDVCNKIDVYGEPWLEKQCRCRAGKTCSDSLRTDDGHTIVDRHFRYKTCEPVKRLPICRYFKDIAWTIETNVGPKNASVHRVQCRCRPNSSSYMVKRQMLRDPETGEKKFVYHFSCSPQSRNKCNLAVKEPCRLTTVHKKHQFTSLDEVTSAQLCQCPRGYRCPKKHTDVGNIPSRTFLGDLPVKVYSGHCTPLRHSNEPVYTLVH